jgi:hypothetical protein
LNLGIATLAARLRLAVVGFLTCGVFRALTFFCAVGLRRDVALPRVCAWAGATGSTNARQNATANVTRTKDPEVLFTIPPGEKKRGPAEVFGILADYL